MQDASAVRAQPGAVDTYRKSWSLAWPVSISTSTMTLLTLVNLFWIGHLGTISVAAVSLCGNILFIVFGLSNIVYGGAVAIVSRRVGEKNTAAAFESAIHAICLGAILGLVVAALGWLTSPAIVGFFDAGPEVEVDLVGETLKAADGDALEKHALWALPKPAVTAILGGIRISSTPVAVRAKDYATSEAFYIRQCPRQIRLIRHTNTGRAGHRPADRPNAEGETVTFPAVAAPVRA